MNRSTIVLRVLLPDVPLTRTAAITSALEIAGPGARVLQVSREGEW